MRNNKRTSRNPVVSQKLSYVCPRCNERVTRWAGTCKCGQKLTWRLYKNHSWHRTTEIRQALVDQNWDLLSTITFIRPGDKPPK